MKYFNIKICGITRIKDVCLLNQLGADLMGMIFYKKSPRCTTMKKAKEFVRESNPTIQKVGVFVNEEVEKILKIAQALNLDFVQLHGSETNKEISLLQKNNLKVIKAFHITQKSDYDRLVECKAELVLVDNMTKCLSGGTGERFDWQIVPPERINNLILAGGLNISNVKSGLKIFSPLVIDLNSGVESSPGLKSEKKLKQIFKLCNRLRYGI